MTTAMVSPTTLYVITAFVWDDDYEKEGLREPEVYAVKSAANAAARKLMNRYADLLNPLGDRDEWDFHHNLDDEGLYRGESVLEAFVRRGFPLNHPK